MDDEHDLAELLDELESTLEALRTEVGPERRRRGPPTPRELARITEEYTIPTVIASLEATIRALELLRRLLRLADPERSARRGADAGAEEAGQAVADELRDALGDLRGTLRDSDLPDDSEASSIIADARELSAAIESRLAEESSQKRDGAAAVDVTGAGAGGDPGTGGDDHGGVDGSDSDSGTSDHSDTDVDSELRSIKDELDGGQPDESNDEKREETP